MIRFDNVLSALQTLMLGLLAMAVGYWFFGTYLAKPSRRVHFAADESLSWSLSSEGAAGPVLENTLGDAELTCDSERCGVTL